MSAELAGATALVTGASGFIGAHLSARLVESGCRVHAVSRSEGHQRDGGPAWHRRDLTQASVVRDLVLETQPDYVFHLASHVMGAPDIAHVLPAFHANLQTTVNLLTACVEVPCRRVVLMGSLVEPDVGDERVPSSPYAAAKWAASDYGRMFHRLYGLPVSIARAFMVYGPAQPDTQKLIPNSIGKWLRGERVKIGNGERLIDWVYVEDVVAGLLAMAGASRIDGESVDLGSGTLISTRELVLTLKALMSADAEVEFGAASDRPHEPIRKANVAKSGLQIGWRPQVDLAEGLKRTIEWYAARTEERA
jgi:UDP-glucose 4-epimerase